jgi:hypothetical protein
MNEKGMVEEMATTGGDNKTGWRR